MAVITPPTLGATPVLVVALVANAGLAGWAWWAGRGAAPADGAAPAGGDARTWRLVAAAAVTLVLGAACMLFYGEAGRAVPPIAGLALGAFIAALAGEDDAAGPVLPLGLGLAALAGLGLAVAPGVPLTNAAIGLVAGWGAASLAAPGASAGLVGPAAVALAAAAGAWGEKLWPDMGAGWPLALALGTCLSLALAIAGKASPSRPGVAAAIGAVGYGLLALLVLLGGYSAPSSLLWAAAAGAAGAAVLPLLLTDRPDLAGLGRLAFLVAGGALLVLDNWLFGILAIGYGGLGLAAGAAAAGPARAWLGLLVALFAARTWIQLFLDRTSLTGYGVDLTHPYSFAALILGALAPGALLAARAALGGHRPLGVVLGLALALGPAWVGYFVHVEALGAWLAGLTLAVFALAAAPPGASPLPGGDAPVLPLKGENTHAVLAPLLLANIGVTLMAAPWLVEVMNASRHDRLVGLLGGALVLAAIAGWWWVARGRAPVPAPGEG